MFIQGVLIECGGLVWLTAPARPPAPLPLSPLLLPNLSSFSIPHGAPRARTHDRHGVHNAGDQTGGDPHRGGSGSTVSLG